MNLPMRRLWAALVIVCMAVLASPTRARATEPAWTWPFDPKPVVAHPFVRPAETWAAGHRGVDLVATSGDAAVRAVDDGVVTHVGVIAGVPTLSITHAGGVRSTYQPVVTELKNGSPVTQGEVIGVLTDQGSHCAPRACLHLGAIRGTTYLDPLRFLRPVRIILLPLDP